MSDWQGLLKNDEPTPERKPRERNPVPVPIDRPSGRVIDGAEWLRAQIPTRQRAVLGWFRAMPTMQREQFIPVPRSPAASTPDDDHTWRETHRAEIDGDLITRAQCQECAAQRETVAGASRYTYDLAQPAASRPPSCARIARIHNSWPARRRAADVRPELVAMRAELPIEAVRAIEAGEKRPYRERAAYRRAVEWAEANVRRARAEGGADVG